MLTFCRFVFSLAVVCLVVAADVSDAATLLAGFTETRFVGNLTRPTAMAFAPDGRLFVCEQGGRLRVVKNGVLLATPFATVTVDQSGERGLLGVAFDPDFATNRYVYVYYTLTTSPRRNRVSRFTANGDVAISGSEVVLLTLNALSASNHNGGALHFGPDGKLYIAVGDNAVGSNAQSNSTLLGKMLRINKDGSIPPDNPYYAQNSGANRAIWALGLRNPFTFAFDPVTGTMFINDVGQNNWEEINEGRPSANYGWPYTEGAISDPRVTSPRFAYHHSAGSLRGCAITGGTFYHPTASSFPAEYVGRYFFADYCAGWIASLNPATNAHAVFATNVPAAVDLRVDTHGDLYYLARGDGTTGAGSVFKVSYGAAPPGITRHPASASVAPGATATFTIEATGTGPLSYQWTKDSVAIPGATLPSYTTPPVQFSDNGASFRATVTNQFGSVTSDAAVVTVTQNMAPTATIVEPASGALYTAGMPLGFSGTGTDPEDGTLAPAAFSWVIDFHHDQHFHPFTTRTGVQNGSVTIPTSGETASNVWYRIHLTVTDSGGLAHSTFRDVLPRKSTTTLTTDPAGLQLLLDGQPAVAPFAFEGVVGLTRTIGAPTSQTLNGVNYTFVSWSDAGAATHGISTPATDTTYTATYRASAGCTAPPGAPTDLRESGSGSSLTLSWTAPTGSNPPSSYVVEGGVSPGTTAQRSTVPGSTTTMTVANMPAGTFYLRVRGTNACGTGAPSNELVVRR